MDENHTQGNHTSLLPTALQHGIDQETQICNEHAEILEEYSKIGLLRNLSLIPFNKQLWEILGLRKTGSRANATAEIYFSDTIPDTEIQAHLVHEEQRVPSRCCFMAYDTHL